MESEDLDLIPTSPQSYIPAHPPHPPSDDARHIRESSDPPNPLRPNKYHGPAQTWRDWTAAERDISRSLDLIRARDLSAHLYNAHCLGIRAQMATREQKGSGASRRVWAPAAEWTAWPMLVGDVPRGEVGIRRGFTDDEDFEDLDWARGEMREVLLACVTREARRRFQGREVEGDGHEGMDAVLSSPGSVPGLDSGNDGQSQHQSKRIKHSSSNVSHTSPPSSKRKRRFPSEEPTLRPAPLADDDLAMQIAQPSIEHIISSLEHLLQALHTARKHYLVSPKPPTKTSRKPAKKRAHGSLEISDSSTSGTTASSTGPIPMKTRSYNRYGSRNWRDILGLAAMVGWDNDALRRTRDRCAVLFGERVCMPDLGLNPKRKAGVKLDGKNSAGDGHVDNGGGSGQEDEEVMPASEDEMFGGVHVNGYMRPIRKRKGWRGRTRSGQKQTTGEQAKEGSKSDEDEMNRDTQDESE